MTRLPELRANLRGLRHRRRMTRLGVGYSALAVAVLWVLAVAFLADWLLEMDRPQRTVSLVVCACCVGWAFRRFSLQWLRRRETELEMALLVERRQHIDSDLVAALQFESPNASQWGSAQLEQAVIDHTAELSRDLDVMEGFSWKPLLPRGGILVVTVLVVAAVAWRCPDHVSAFLNRFLLGSRHYPTQTVMETVKINDQRLDPTGFGRATIQSAYGRPVRFEVTCSGQLPAAGRAELKTLRGGVQTTLPLEPGNSQAEIFIGKLPTLTDSVTCRLYLGDAWTDPLRLLVVPLPVADLELSVTPPNYARKSQKPSKASTSLRQISVIEGSRVDLAVRSNKQLQDATLSVGGRQYPLTHRSKKGVGSLFRPTDSPRGKRVDRKRLPTPFLHDYWVLDSAEVRTPLRTVLKQVQYAIDVTDVDGLHLEQPIRGVIRLRADRPPRVAVSAVTQYVLPTAKPTISYEATDDYGLARLSVVRQVVRKDGGPQPEKENRLPKGKRPVTAKRGRYPLDLAPLKLGKGDQLKIAVRAVDYRYPRQGKSTTSEPVVFQVTDEQGILAVMAESDKQSDRRLETMIQGQIEVGAEQ